MISNASEYKNELPINMGELMNRTGLPEKLPQLRPGDYGDIKLVARRDSVTGEPFTNVHRRFTESDADNWGYAGTGPWCLTANILYHFTNGDMQFVERERERFCVEVLAKLPMESFILSGEFVRLWIEKRRAEDRTGNPAEVELYLGLYT